MADQDEFVRSHPHTNALCAVFPGNLEKVGLLKMQQQRAQICPDFAANTNTATKERAQYFVDQEGESVSAEGLESLLVCPNLTDITTRALFLLISTNQRASCVRRRRREAGGCAQRHVHTASSASYRLAIVHHIGKGAFLCVKCL